MVFYIHSDASYFLVSNARRRVGGLFFLGNKSHEQDTLNGSIRNVAVVIKTVERTNPSAQRATQLRSVLARVYAVARQNQSTVCHAGLRRRNPICHEG
jgi:hypothetical protein